MRLLRGLLIALLPVAFVDDHCWRTFAAAMRERCATGPVIAGACCHCQAFGALQVDEGIAPQVLAAEWLHQSTVGGEGCEALRTWASFLCASVASKVAECVLQGDWPTDALAQPSLPRVRKRKLRVAESYRSACARVVRLKGAITRRRLLQARGRLHPAVASRWASQDAQTQLAVGWLRFGSCSSLSLAPDATRLVAPQPEPQHARCPCGLGP